MWKCASEDSVDGMDAGVTSAEARKRFAAWSLVGDDTERNQSLPVGAVTLFFCWQFLT